MTHRRVDVPILARVEGEGALHVAVDDGVVRDVRLEIFEPPRYFEGLLRGRPATDVPDLVARVCGICPVAYQMSAVHAIERLFGMEVPPGTAALRRLLYCAEWIESHMLHVHLLAAPDFLGYDHALDMAQGEPGVLERGLRLKRAGGDLMAAIGGRRIHPVSPRVGGFSAVPAAGALAGFVARFEEAAAEILEVAAWVGGFELPSLDHPAELVALVHPTEYPMNEGTIATSAGRHFDSGSFEDHVVEHQVAHATALHATLAGAGPYVVGPLARLHLNEGRLGPLARTALAATGVALPTADRFAALGARVAETAVAVEEVLRLLRDYVPPDPPAVPVTPVAGRATWVTEAPRGILYHRYDIDGDGVVRTARLVPPTGQNLRHMEEDLRALLPGIVDRPQDELTRLCEMAVRNYDPCISCATHFLRVEVERSP